MRWRERISSGWSGRTSFPRSIGRFCSTLGCSCRLSRANAWVRLKRSLPARCSGRFPGHLHRPRRARSQQARWARRCDSWPRWSRACWTRSYNRRTVTGVATILYPEEEIQGRVREIGRAIARDYAERSPVLICILKGAVVFLADLFREIDLPVRVDFMSISSYGAGSEATGGVVRILKDLDQDIGGADVIVVEDIIDTGLTLSYLLANLRARQPASLEVCTLLDKSVRRIAPLDIKYSGFDCPDRFVVGYGLDHGERYRNLRAILAVDDQSVLAADPDALVGFLGNVPSSAAETLQEPH